MTKVIEILVIGPTGSGKSHVLELIAKALYEEYGRHAQVVSHDLSCERGLGSPGTKPAVSDTIFNLRERGEVSFRKLGERRVSSGSQLDSPDVSPVVQGEAISFALDPLDQAIESTARVMRDEREQMASLSMTLGGGVPATAVHNRMGEHLDLLLEAQLKRVTAHEAR